MKIISRIADILNIRCVRFTDGGTEISTVACNSNGGKPLGGGRAPVVMIVSGKGVITKDASAAIAETVTSDPATFIWTISGDKISFMRRDQLAEVAQGDALYVECVSEITDDTLAGVAGRFRTEYLSWRRVLAEHVLASLVSRLLLLPVLGILFAVLMVNFAVSARVNDSYREAGAQLKALRKTSSANAETDERRQAAIEEFSHRITHDTDRLSDLIAASVPKKITLDELNIAPVLKTPEKGKPVTQSENMIIIRGVSSASEAITEFTEALAELRLGTVRLTSLLRDRERTTLMFRIEITL